MLRHQLCNNNNNNNSFEKFDSKFQCLSTIQKLADKNGFQFSKSKTVCTHFSQLHLANTDLDLKLNGTSIPVVSEFKYLGLIFHRQLTFKGTLNS